jgi:DDE superfamily endonuclease
MVILKVDCKRLDINCRHSVALTGVDRHRKRVVMALFRRLERAHAEFVNNGEDFEARGVRRYTRRVIEEYLSISTVPQKVYIRYRGVRLGIDSESIQEGMLAASYRFKSREQLRRLAVGFNLPAFFVIPNRGFKFRGEELLLIALECCALGIRYLNLQQKYKIHHSNLCRGVNYFAGWMQDNWGYLLRDHMEFWGEYLEDSRNVIRDKMLTHYNFDVTANDQDVFKVAMFIDCTIVPSSRTGGGPMNPGIFALRYPYIVQEAFYNGWKKCHGIKKQSIGLANGMAFQVSKGYSCRRHDLHILDESNVDARLVELTSENPPSEQFTCYGDSAYPQMQRISCKRDGDEHVALNSAMNGCRESIEWMYGDLSRYWKVIGKKNAFHLLTDFEKANDLIDLCFQFNNAWNAMNHNQASQWFQCPPPSFEFYTL